MPPLRTTIGQLAVNQALPPKYRDYNRVLSKGAVAELFQKIAEEDPDAYREASKKLLDVGAAVAYETGGYSFGLKSLLPSTVYREARIRLETQIDQILDGEGSSAQKKEQVVELIKSTHQRLEKEIMQKAIEDKNPIALQVQSGARGNSMNLKSLLAADGLYQDHRDRTIPFAILNGYSSGMDPAEYFAATFGARKGVIDTKLAVQRGGFFSKQLVQLNHRLVVTAQDADGDGEPDTMRGMPVDTDDMDSAGALLSQPAGGYPRNTVLTPKVLRDLNTRGVRKILVRSPLVGGAPDGGLYARDVGVRERGNLPPRGDNVGIAAAQALSEPISQGALCLIRGTLVRMADWSTKPIEEIRPGDWVLGADLNRNTFPVLVLDRFDNGIRDCYETVFSPAYSKEEFVIGSTLDHKILGSCQVWGQKEEELNFVPRLLPIGTKSRSFYAHLPTGTIHTSYLDVDGGTRKNPMHKFVVSRAGQIRHLTRLVIGRLVGVKRREVEAALRFAARCHDEYRLIRRRQTLLGQHQTYDLHVDHPDHLFVLANGLIVSNSSKHSGGVVGAAKAVSGFDTLNQMIQVPKESPHWAAIAEDDGHVQAIEDAPAGGKFVTVNGKQHYVPVGQQITVKRGDEVEAGDVLSDGIPNHNTITRYKGIGDGRYYFTHAFKRAMGDAGLGGHRRNIELLARGLINHVELADEVGDHSPGDIITYDALERAWEPRPGARKVHPRSAMGKYLERPVLHYTVGTKIRPSVVKHLADFGINEVDAHDDPPPFQPMMVRSMENLQHDPDWMSRHLGSNLKKTTLHGVERGDVADTEGTSYVAGLALAPHSFGRKGVITDFKPPPRAKGGVL